MVKNGGLSQRSRIPVVVMVLVFFLILPYTVWGQGPARMMLESTSPQKIGLIVGKSMIVTSPGPIKRVSLGSTDIADALVLTARQVSLTGKAPGVTNLTLWGMDNKVFAILDLEISPDVSRIEETLRKILPEEKNISVMATHDNITLSGTVSSLPKREEVLRLVEPYFPRKVVDLLKIEPSNTEVSKFQEMLMKTLPEEKDIRVSVVRDNIIIAGTVSTKSKSSQVQSLAELYFPKKVTNLLEVEPPLDVTVSNASRFKEMLYEILPEEKDIKVTPTYSNVTLSGTVSSTSNLSQVLTLAKSYFPEEKDKEKIVNLLEVGGVHQVMLEVRVAEMSRSLMKRLGFNFGYLSKSGQNFGVSLLNNLTTFLPNQGGTSLGASGAINGILRFVSWGATWTVFIDALKEDGLLKVLAEPTLITLSGKTANFLAGGEFPIPVPQQLGGVNNVITIEYKPFGVALNFTPIVLSNKKISMQVAPEVSELDFANAISISGFVVPALSTRRVSTTVELADGQSFAIAGLLKDEVREVITKFPLLGDVPILGALFRSSNFQKNETELVVIVTPHLVKPLDLAKQTLPTDQFIEPDDFEFYVLGSLEGREKMKPVSPGSSVISPNKGVKLEGNFGHIVPK